MQQSSVIMNLWPYLLALETDERRFNFVQKVYNREFDLETLKIGNEICIRTPQGSEPKYYEFKVKYFGEATSKGVGSYISLQLKNDHVALTGELENLSQYYRFMGKGIVVPADWIMLNLYKKEECQSESLINMFPEMAVVTKTLNNSPPSMLIANYNANRFVKPYEKRLRQPSPSVETPKKFSEKGSTSKSPNLFESPTEKNMVMNNTNELINNTDKPVRLPSPIMEQSINLNDTDATMETLWYSPPTQCETTYNKLQYYGRNKAEIPHQLTSPVTEQPQNTKTGDTWKTHLYSPHTQYETTYNKYQYYARNNAEILQSASPIIEQPQNTNTDAPCKTPLLPETNYNKKLQNHAAEIESITKADGAVKNAEKTKCCSCSKTVEIGCGVILRECIHSFCIPCIHHHIEHNLKYSGIRCPYSEEYECEFDLLDAEIRDIGGDLIYNRILDNRLNEYVGNDPNARVCFNENCKHVWVSKWTVRGNNERCPECNTNWCYLCNGKHDPKKQHKSKWNATKDKKEEPVVEFRKRLDAERVQVKADEKCERCSKRACKQLSLCGHWFCSKCIQDSIKEQGFDNKKNSITCDTCKAVIIESDIAQFVGKKIFAKVKSKIVAVKKVPKQVDHPLNSGSKVSAERLKCEKTEEPLIRKIISEVTDHQMKSDFFEKCGGCNNRADVKLSSCQHWFCNKCIQSLIKNQAFDPNQLSINCIACNDPISDSEVLRYGEKSIFDLYKSKVGKAKLAPKPADQPREDGNKELIECLKCEDKFEERLIHKCLKCVSSICLNCANTTISGQLANKCPLKCLFCQTLLNKSQIAMIKKATFNETPKEKISYKETDSPQPVAIGFECLVCKKSADRDSQVVLTKCKHQVCQKCLREKIESQKIWSKYPRCPMCMEPIDQMQLKIIEVSLDTLEKSSGNEEDPKDICGICQQYLELNGTKALSVCKHRFCFQCITKALNDQSFINRVPRCPSCSNEVSSADTIALCGPEGFKRYMVNKRKK